MKRLLVAAAAVAAVATAAPAFAETTTISGNVPAVCQVTQTNSAINVGTLSANSAGVVSVTGATAPFQDLANGFCNGVSSTITVSATPLTSDVTIPASQQGSFTNRVDYSFSFLVDGANVGAVDTASGTGVNNAIVGLFDGTLGTDSDLAPANTGGKRLVADTYEGSITFTLAPAA